MFVFAFCVFIKFIVFFSVRQKHFVVFVFYQKLAYYFECRKKVTVGHAVSISNYLECVVKTNFKVKLDELANYMSFIIS